MKKMIAMLLASVMAVGTFTTTAFAYTGDDVQKNTPVSTAAQETDAAESTNAGKTDNIDSIEIDPDMQVLPDGYEVSTDADGNLSLRWAAKNTISAAKSPKSRLVRWCRGSPVCIFVPVPAWIRRLSDICIPVIRWRLSKNAVTGIR